MNDSLLETAVLSLVFNRPGTIWMLFDQRRKTRPRELFVADDGPRNGVAYLDVEPGDFYDAGMTGFMGNCPLLVYGSWEVK